MKYNQLTEEAPAKDIRAMLSTIALSLLASGRTEVSVKSLTNEIRKRTNIDVPYNVMMDVLNSLPFVQDANSDTVTLTSQGTDSTAETQDSDNL